MHIRTFLKPLSFIPAIILMYMIFSFSAQTGEISSSVSYKASCVIVKTADNVFDMGMDDYQISYYATKINGVTRKLAHMTEYFLLAIAVSFPLYVYGVHGILLMILAGGICIAFACGDEYHQSFVAGRSPSVKDVGIDSVGVFIGIIIVRIIGWTGRMTIFRPIRKKTDSQNLSMKQQKAMEQMQQNTYNQGYTPYQDSCSQASGESYAGPNQNYPGQGFPNPSGYPYPKDQYSNQPYSQGGYASGYPGQSAPYPEQNPPYQQASYSASSGTPYPDPNYSAQRNGSYPGQNYSSMPYPDPNYQGPGYDPYSTPSYSDHAYGSNYQGNEYPGNYQQPQTPQYMGRQDESSDELSEDMPLSHLLKPKKRK